MVDVLATLCTKSLVVESKQYIIGASHYLADVRTVRFNEPRSLWELPAGPCRFLANHKR
jgi:hypothetical protein